MKTLKLFLYLLLANSLLFISCTSLQQDIVISSIPQDEVKELSDYEFRLVHLDADYSYSAQSSNSEIQERNSACESLIKDIDKLLSNKDLVLAAQARLIAIKGRTYLIEKQTGKAKECYQLSLQTYKGDIQNIILAHRLGLLDDLTKAGFAAADKSVIIIEQAIDYYKSKEYISLILMTRSRQGRTDILNFLYSRFRLKISEHAFSKAIACCSSVCLSSNALQSYT